MRQTQFFTNTQHPPSGRCPSHFCPPESTRPFVTELSPGSPMRSQKHPFHPLPVLAHIKDPRKASEETEIGSSP